MSPWIMILLFRTLIPAGEEVKAKRKSSESRRTTIEEKLSDVKCPDDEKMSAWDCPVCLYILRLELRMNFGIIPMRNTTF